MVRIFVCLFVLSIPNDRIYAQVKAPVKWHFSAVQKSDKEAELVFTATMDEGWHIYSQFLEEGGPLPTTFTFSTSPDYERIDKVKEESTPIEKFDPTFMMPVVWFDKTALFTQRIKLKVPATTVKGKVEFMACTDYECLLPEEVVFSIEVKAEKSEKKTNN